MIEKWEREEEKYLSDNFFASQFFSGEGEASETIVVSSPSFSAASKSRQIWAHGIGRTDSQLALTDKIEGGLCGVGRTKKIMLKTKISFFHQCTTHSKVREREC